MTDKTYTPCLFQAIAKEVASGFGEQYLIAIKDSGLAVMFSTPAIESAISKAVAQIQDGISILKAEFNIGNFHSRNAIFANDSRGLCDVNGVLVEFVVKKLRDDAYRVFFSRVDAAQVYVDVADRLNRVENAVRELQASKELA